MFDRVLNPLLCINCLINDKKRYFKVGQINWRGRQVHEVSQKLVSLDFDSWHYGQHYQMPTWNLRAVVCYTNFEIEFLVLAIATFSEVQFVKQT